MVTDYDFRLARTHLRGTGWRGLAALALVLIARTVIVGAITFSARAGAHWLVPLLEHLV